MTAWERKNKCTTISELLINFFLRLYIRIAINKKNITIQYVKQK